MPQNTTDAARLRKYLLAELDPVEQAQIEETYFLDDDAFEQLGIVEDELIDEYVAGELRGREHAAFEHRYLTTSARRERVAFARTMREAGRRHSVAARDSALQDTPWLARAFGWLSTPTAQWALAAASLVMIVTTAWLTIERTRLEQAIVSLDRQRVESANEAARLASALDRERQRAETLAAQQAARPGEPPPAPAAITPIITTFTLTPGLSRSVGGGNELRLQPGTALVRLTMPLETNSHPRYRAVLTNASGDELWTQQGLAAGVDRNAVTLTIDVPASALSNRDYILTISGVAKDNRVEEIADYVFRVTRP